MECGTMTNYCNNTRNRYSWISYRLQQRVALVFGLAGSKFLFRGPFWEAWGILQTGLSGKNIYKFFTSSFLKKCSFGWYVRKLCAIELVFTCTTGVKLVNSNPVRFRKIKYLRRVVCNCAGQCDSVYMRAVMPSIPIGMKLWTCSSFFGAIGIICTCSFVNIFDVCVLFWRERKCRLSSIHIPTKKQGTATSDRVSLDRTRQKISFLISSDPPMQP